MDRKQHLLALNRVSCFYYLFSDLLDLISQFMKQVDNL